jgi:hypothetical protein
MDLCHRWYGGQERALPPVVQRPGKGSSTGGTVARKGLFHLWYGGQERALPPVVQWPGIETDDPPTCSIDVKNAWSYAVIPACVFTLRCFMTPSVI